MESKKRNRLGDLWLLLQIPCIVLGVLYAMTLWSLEERNRCRSRNRICKHARRCRYPVVACRNPALTGGAWACS